MAPGEEGRMTDEEALRIVAELEKWIHNKPLPKKIVNQILREKYKKPVGMQISQASCTICCENFVEKETLVILPCFHKFHESCSLEWFKKQNFCPIDKLVLEQKYFS